MLALPAEKVRVVVELPPSGRWTAVAIERFALVTSTFVFFGGGESSRTLYVDELFSLTLRRSARRRCLGRCQ